MSSDESTSTQISSISSQAGVVQKKLKPHKAQQWEIDLIGNFMLSLYHRSLISPQNNWICVKTDMRKEFEQFTESEIRQRLKVLNGTDNIGTLLHRCSFLWNTPRGNPCYILRGKEIFDFRNKQLKLKDKRQLNGDIGDSQSANNSDPTAAAAATLALFQVDFEIDEDSPKHALVYQGTAMQQRRNNYHPTNMSCVICQQDFSTMDSYEEHIQKHNDESDFEYTSELSQFDSPIFKMSYSLCKNSHYFCFNFETDTNNLVIEKIIIVQSRTLYYVRQKRVPYDMPTAGCDKFFVDSHLFTMFVEQPIIMIAYIKGSKETRIIEEHNFMRSLEFPKVHIATKPSLLPSKKLFKPFCKLPEYFPPAEIRDTLRGHFVDEKLMKTSNEIRDYIRNGKVLQPQTIGPTLGTLLHIEDMETINEYMHLLQHNVKLRSFGDDYSLKLKPKQRICIENILSTFDDIIITKRTDIKAHSDKLLKFILTPQEDLPKNGIYVGRIEDVNSERVSFKSYNKLDTKVKYTIFFRPSRIPLRYQYRAMELLPEVMPYLRKFLFPAQLVPRPLSSISLNLYNKKIYSNPEQLQAVRNIAEGPRNDAPYIIFGPPGTGKTETLVESILQVLKRKDTKILVTASSNSACDEIALRLCRKITELNMPRAIVRIYAKSNEARSDNIDDLLLEHSNMDNNHFLPDIEVLHEYRIVVCTKIVVGKLATGKFGRNINSGTMYTHVFIDEVAASTEVESMIPITTALTPKSCLIIAGDCKQLGPVIKSKRAEELGLGVSLMDRLLQRDCYRVNTDTGDYDRTIQSRLRRNYRSHPAIVNIYSAMYYNHDLEAHANVDDVSVFKNWHRTPNKDFPIMFHSVNGSSRSDAQSHSLYNSTEVDIVMDYVKDLMYFGINGQPVLETDIGIISPYKKQYLRIREELNLRKWYAIETGSVETFQGKEKVIIIASFVRSGTSTLGFLDSPRRLNVTISRAKSLLILVGNAKTLSMNPDFEYIVKECQRHKTFIGTPTKASNTGKISKSYKTDPSMSKKSSKQQQQSKTNLESIFDELPNVPKKDNMIAAGNSTVQQVNMQMNGPPTTIAQSTMPSPLVNAQFYYNQQQQQQLQHRSQFPNTALHQYQLPQQQQQPHPALFYNHPPNHRYPMITPQQQQQQQAMFQHRPTQMGMPPPPMQTQQQLLHQQQQRQQLMPNNPNPFLSNNNKQMPAATAATAVQFQQSSQANAASQNTSGGGKAGKKSRQRRKNKAANSPTVDSSNKNDISNNDDPKASPSKLSGKPNLAHSMKTKNQHPEMISKAFKIGDIPNINKSVKTTDNIVVTTLADIKKPTTVPLSPTTATTPKSKQSMQDPTAAATAAKDSNVNATTSQGNTTKTLTIDETKTVTVKRVNKVVASIPPMKFDSESNTAAGGGAISKAAQVQTTSSTSNNPFLSGLSTNETKGTSVVTSNNPSLLGRSTNLTTGTSITSNNPFLSGLSTNVTKGTSGTSVTSNNTSLSGTSTNQATGTSITSNNPFRSGTSVQSSSSVSSVVTSPVKVINKAPIVQTSSANATPTKTYRSLGSTGGQNVISSSSTAYNRQSVSTNAATTGALSNYSSTSTATIAAASAYTSGASNPIQKSAAATATKSSNSSVSSATLSRPTATATPIITPRTSNQPLTNGNNIYPNTADRVSNNTNSSSSAIRTSSPAAATAADTTYSSRQDFGYSQRPIRTFSYKAPKQESKCVIA